MDKSDREHDECAVCQVRIQQMEIPFSFDLKSLCYPICLLYWIGRDSNRQLLYVYPFNKRMTILLMLFHIQFISFDKAIHLV